MKTNQGAVLVSALLFLSVITVLVLSMTHMSLMASKMQYNYQAKLFSLQKAEQNLRSKESLLLQGTISTGPSLIASPCGVNFYKITVSGDYHGTQSTLQSTFAILGNTSSCDPKPTVKTGRQSWREIL